MKKVYLGGFFFFEMYIYIYIYVEKKNMFAVLCICQQVSTFLECKIVLSKLF